MSAAQIGARMKGTEAKVKFLDPVQSGQVYQHRLG